MTDAREQMERVVAETLKSQRASWGTPHLTRCIVDAVERALAPEPPAPLKVWPGLEEAERLYVARYNTPANTTHQGARLAGLAAAAPHLWRALVASLPGWEGKEGLLGCVSVGRHLVPRAALAALADPYDGGGKGEA